MSILAIQNLTCGYNNSIVIKNLNLSISSDAVTGLVGPNGAGKSTLFQALTGSIKPIEGAVYWDSVRIDGKMPHEIARLGISRTFQIPHIFESLTVEQNIGLFSINNPGINPLNALLRRHLVRDYERSIQSRIDEILKIVHLDEVRKNLAGNISGGQKKLLEIGRVLMADPKYLLLDEPGAGVNPILMETIIDVLLALKNVKGIGFLLVEHNMGIINQICDQVAVMNFGELIDFDRPSVVFNNPNVIEAYSGF
ncbi:MAG: ATP-binding cassette domain-containing protein [Chloroflexota bacterium]